MSISAVMPTYARTDVVFDRGEGAWLYATDGRRFLDFGGGIAVTSLGHAHPHLVAALQEQAAKLWHCSNLYRIAGQEKVAARLVANSFADTVFFCNSGAEAMECAIKIARRFHQAQGAKDKFRVITARGAFHGRTLATISAGGQEKHLDGFAPKVDGFDQVAFGNLNETRAAITPQTAALVVEPIQGEGGIIPADPQYLQGLRQVADEFGLLLIFDEVQCGLGRTGKLFAYEWAGVTPDVMALAKGLGGGFPVGACLATERAAQFMTPGTHGSTFGGNPLAMSAASAVLDVMLADGFHDRTTRIADHFWTQLRPLVAKHSGVFAEVRGKGLMIGLKCKVPNGDVIARAMDNGLLAVAGGDNVIRLLPSLLIGEAEVDAAVAILDRTATELAA
ncbi:MAG: aspartate aminotransferase family protein [Rhodospirillaceae bacterium]|nr:MAG: aspartate aminotransferase family protein [Rhodospirillaceae bacterium]